MRWFKGVAFVAATVVALACFGRSETFDHLKGADRVEVRTDHDELLKTIRDPAVISAVQACIARHDLGWSRPWYGSPVPRLQVTFYKASHLLGGFGLGHDFLTTDPGPMFMSRSITHEEALRIAALMGVALPSD